MNLISDIDIEDLVKNELEEDERIYSAHMDKIASRPQKGTVITKFYSKQLDIYN